MEFRNSYVFIKRNKKSNIKGENQLAKQHIILEPTFIRLFSKSFDDILFDDKNGVNDTINSGSFKIISKNRKTKIFFKFYDIFNNKYLDIIVKDKSKLSAINILEMINNSLIKEKNNFDQQYISIISYDYVSEYYCNELYPLLNEFERKLRKLLFCIYTLNYNEEYYTAYNK